jgi:ABC-type spermidine/putrescine transport system permease subunit II
VRLLSRVLVGATIVVMLVPAIVVVMMSFNGTEFVQFPPESWGVRQWSGLAESSFWRDALVDSFRVAIPAAIIATIAGTTAVLSIQRSALRFSGTLQVVVLLPLLLPAVAFAFALYTMFAELRILGSYVGLVLVHAVLGLPFVALTVSAALLRISPQLELVAMTLGASRRRAMVGVTLRLLTPAMVAGFVLAFMTSFDDAVFVSFLGGPELVTVPKAIFESLRTGLDPVIPSLATVLMVFTAAVMGLAVYLRKAEAAES